MVGSALLLLHVAAVDNATRLYVARSGGAGDKAHGRAGTRGIPIVKVNPKGLFVAETPDFRDKLRELEGGAFFLKEERKGEEARKNLRGKCADTFGQPSLYRECGSSGRRCTG